jgi:hypothetical protein
MKKYLTLLFLLIILLSACQGNAPAATPIPPTDKPAPTLSPTATAAPLVKSGDGSEPVTLMVDNQTSETLEVYWWTTMALKYPMARLIQPAS